MAQKTRTTLQNDSDSIFLDNTSGQIIPANHRDFNDDVIDSCANLEDNNVFDGDNQFTATTQMDGSTIINGAADFNATAIFNDKVTHAAQVVSNYAGASVASAATIDLTNVDGNLIFITGSTTINVVDGNIGAIFYCTFVDGTTMIPSGTSIQPAVSTSYNAGDTIIFVIQAANQIRIISQYRAGSGNYFPIDYTDFETIRLASSLQIGALYEVDNVPNITNFYAMPDFKIRAFAILPDEVASNALWFLYDDWIPAIVLPTDISDIRVYGSEMTQKNELIMDTFNTDNSGSPVFWPGSNVMVIDGANNQFRSLVTGNYTAQKINLVEYSQKGLAGIYIPDSTLTPYWYRNDGTHDIANNRWGNNPIFEFTGITAALLEDYNTNPIYNFNNDIVVSSIEANYQVVNQLCTITINCIFETSFESESCGHSAILYFPLPFRVIQSQTIIRGNGIGHGSLEFVDNCNHQNIGVIASSMSSVYDCVFSAKWSNNINSPELVRMSASYTYHINA